MYIDSDHAMHCIVEHNAPESSKNIHLMSNLMETFLVILYRPTYKDDARRTDYKTLVEVMIIHTVSTMLEQSPR